MPNCAFLIDESQFQHSRHQHPSPRRSHKNLNFKAACQTSSALVGRVGLGVGWAAADMPNDRNFRQKSCARAQGRRARYLSAARTAAAGTPPR